MALSEDKVSDIAKLARLEISAEQKTALSGSLSAILDLVEQLQNADTSDVTPMAHPLTGMSQRLRADAVTEVNDRETFQSTAPAVEAGLYLVPKVIE